MMKPTTIVPLLYILTVSSPSAQECPMVPKTSGEMFVGGTGMGSPDDRKFKLWMKNARMSELDRALARAPNCNDKRESEHYVMMSAFAYGEGMGGKTGGFIRVKPAECRIITSALQCYQKLGWPISRDGPREATPSYRPATTSPPGLDLENLKSHLRKQAELAVEAWSRDCEGKPSNDYCDRLELQAKNGHLGVGKDNALGRTLSGLHSLTSTDKPDEKRSNGISQGIAPILDEMKKQDCDRRSMMLECVDLSARLAAVLDGYPDPGLQPITSTERTLDQGAPDASSCVKATKDGTFGYIQNICSRSVFVKFFDMTPGNVCSTGCATGVPAYGRSTINLFRGNIAMGACFSPTAPVGYKTINSKYSCR